MGLKGAMSMEDIYLDREKLHDLREMIKELGVSL